MKPVGLTNPHDPAVKSYAIVQLRQDNKLGTLYNMVGFQTKLKYGAQQRVFRTIPGLANAEFARLGACIATLSEFAKTIGRPIAAACPTAAALRRTDDRREGYVESASIGLIAGLNAAADARSTSLAPPPQRLRSPLLGHITGRPHRDHEPGARSFQPMNINFGLFPPLASLPTRNADGTRLRQQRKTVAKKQAISARALSDLESLGLPDSLRWQAAA